MTYIFLPVGLRSLHFRRFSLKGSYQDIVRNFLRIGIYRVGRFQQVSQKKFKFIIYLILTLALSNSIIASWALIQELT